MGARSAWDAIIVGASTAGCTAAIFMARKGARVLLLDRASDPNAYKKTCSHFIQPSATATLERLGVLGRMTALGATCSAFNTWTPFGWIEQGPEVAGWNLRRERLDPLLRTLAAETKGVELRMGRTVKALVRESGRVTGVVTHASARAGGEAGEPEEVRGHLVVGADGRHSKVADLTGFETRTSANGRFCYLAYYEGIALPTNKAHLWVLDPDTVYALPTDGNQTCLVVMPRKSRLGEFKADFDGAFARIFGSAENGPDVRAGKRVSEFFGMIELPNHIRRPARDGVALLGDAAMTSDPLFGVGVGWALQTGEWLAEDVTDAVVAGERAAIDRALETYATHHGARLRKHHEIINQSSAAKPLNLVESILLGAAARDRSFGDEFARVSARLVQPDAVLTPRGLLRATWIRATKRPLRPIGSKILSRAAPSEWT